MNSRLVSVNHRTTRWVSGTLAKSRCTSGRERHIELRHNPDRRALIDGQLGDFLCQLGNDLHPGGTGADDGCPAAGERIAVIPLGRVDDPPGERINPLDVGSLRLAQEAGRGDHKLRAERLTAGERYPPDPGIVVPTRAFDGGVESHVAAQVVLVCHMLGVALQFAARCIHPRPVRVRFEPVGESGRRLIDGKARIVIDVPRATQVVLAVDDHDVVIAQAVELDRGANSAETRPHDDHVEVLHAHRH